MLLENCNFREEMHVKLILVRRNEISTLPQKTSFSAKNIAELLTPPKPSNSKRDKEYQDHSPDLQYFIENCLTCSLNTPNSADILSL